ncbi:hypothetical protein EVAR_38649_1 [Eumeta japonica]|uniref:Uncharacterized protein n=1 Tax=Eumeta variegata TaxID=151549 RepID=A0A4C1Y0T9_EUMVA|nr:hypothetical protein EVAR_38649_1 [Eumeta japonica]
MRVISERSISRDLGRFCSDNGVKSRGFPPSSAYVTAHVAARGVTRRPRRATRLWMRHNVNFGHLKYARSGDALLISLVTMSRGPLEGALTKPRAAG